MSEGVTLLIIVSMLAAGIISVVMAERRESSLMSGNDWKQLPMLVACDLLFIGSFCVVLFYLYVENMINPQFVTAGWQIGLLVIIIAYLSFGVRRVWQLTLGKHLEKSKTEEKRRPQVGGIVAYMQYALIYMALVLLVILASEIFLCSIFFYFLFSYLFFYTILFFSILFYRKRIRQRNFHLALLFRIVLSIAFLLTFPCYNEFSRIIKPVVNG